MYFALWDNQHNNWDAPFGHGIGPILYPTYKMARKKLGERTGGSYYFKRFEKDGRTYIKYSRKPLNESWQLRYSIKFINLEPVVFEPATEEDLAEYEFFKQALS